MKINGGETPITVHLENWTSPLVHSLELGAQWFWAVIEISRMKFLGRFRDTELHFMGCALGGPMFGVTVEGLEGALSPVGRG